MTANFSLRIGSGGLGSPPGTLELAPSPGNPYRVLEGFDLGAPTALTRTIESAAVDGEKISGRRHGNRVVKMTVDVEGATTAERDANVEALLAFVDSQEWTITWTPDVTAPLPMMILCQRSSFEPDYSLDALPPEVVDIPTTRITIDVVARSFVYTPTATLIDASAPSLLIDALDAAKGTPSALQVYDPDGSNLVLVSWAADSTAGTYLQGSGSNKATVSINQDTTKILRPSIEHDYGSPADLSAYTSIGMYVRVDSSLHGGVSSAHYAVASGAVTGVLNMVDAHGAHRSSAVTAVIPVEGNYVLFTAPMPPGLDWTQITAVAMQPAFTVTISGRGGPSIDVTVHIDDLVALPSSTAQLSAPNGGIYLAAAVPGTARTPIAVTATSNDGTTALKGLVLHKAPPEARADYQQLIRYGSASHALGSEVRLANGGMGFDGSFDVWLAGSLASGSRTVTVKFRLYKTISGTASVLDEVDLTAAITGPGEGNLTPIDVLNWPPRSVPADATGIYTTIEVDDPVGGATAPADVLVLDNRGPCVIVRDAGNTNPNVWIELPDFGKDLGDINVGVTRADAHGKWDHAEATGGPFSLDPGDNQFLAYATQGGPPLVSMSVYAAWLRARTL